jgi:hypothetical protein
MTSPAAAFLLEEPPGVAADFALLAWPSSRRLQGHQERRAGGLQVADDFGTVKTAIQQHQTHFYATLANLSQQPLEHVGERIVLAKPSHRQREAIAFADHIGRGIVVEVRRAPPRLAAPKFVSLL